MSIARDFMSTLAMLREIQTDRNDFDLPALPSLDSALTLLPPLPPQGVLFGVASDGLPVMLDVWNPSPGPVLVLGDTGTGKTDFLRFVAAAITRTHRPDQLQFCALTPRPGEWEGFERLGHCLGIVDTANGAARHALGELAASIQENPASSPVLLLVDDPTSLDSAALEIFHWLLLNGPAARLPCTPFGPGAHRGETADRRMVWPLVTLNAELAIELPSWVALFRTRIFGRIAQPELADELSPAPDAALHNLLSGAQFCLRSEGHWLRFWVPLVPDPV
jgi:hypothetical protein